MKYLLLYVLVASFNPNDLTWDPAVYLHTTPYRLEVGHGGRPFDTKEACLDALWNDDIPSGFCAPVYQ